MEDIVSQYQALKTKSLPISEVRKKAKKALKTDNLEYINEHHRKFVMIDLYPEGSERFHFDFSSLIEDA